MRYWIVAGLLLANICHANDTVFTDDRYYRTASDHFSWTNEGDRAHIAVGFAATVGGSLILEHVFKMNRLPATLSALAVVMIAAPAWEIWINHANKATDVKTRWAGAGIGAITVLSIRI